MNCILLRYGEIGLKSNRTRPRFEKLYKQAIASGMSKAGVEYELKNMGGRFVLYTEQGEQAIQTLKNIPGIQSLSPAHQFTFQTLDDIKTKVQEVAQPQIKENTFCVRVKRTGTHDFSSPDAEKEIGAVLEGTVKLKNPDLRIGIEIRDNECFVYTETINGVGGLPPKSAGKVLCLFSGGIDSPVAAFQMLKRGCLVDFLLFNPMGEKYMNDVAKVYNYLIGQHAYAYTPRFFVFNGKDIMEQVMKVEERYRQVAFKVALYKVAEQVAKEHGYTAVITGESVSQKSSQTVESLMFIQQLAPIPILRPLIGMDKVEIMNIARHIGTLKSSERVKEICNISDGPVVTNPNNPDKIPVFTITGDVKKYHGILEIDEEPQQQLQNIITVDIRPEFIKQKEPLKVDISITYQEALEKTFEKDKSYLFICDFSVKSEDVAHELRKKGIKAAGVNVKNFLKYFQKA